MINADKCNNSLYGVVFDEEGNTQYLSAYSTVILVGE